MANIGICALQIKGNARLPDTVEYEGRSYKLYKAIDAAFSMNPDLTSLSTSMYILGLEKATEYWREYGEDFDMILMTSGGEVYVTEPLSGSLVTDYPVTVIRP